ncbi:MAG: hypothetical protein ACLVCH_10145 [Roseburia inulinivorans]
MAEDKKKEEIAVIDINRRISERKNCMKLEVKGYCLMLILAEIYGYDTKGFNRQVKIILKNLMKILCLNLTDEEVEEFAVQKL